LIALPIFAQWLRKAVATWSATGATPPNGIISFVLNLAGLLSKKEERFCDLNNNNFFIKLVNVLRARQVGVAGSVKLAYIDLLLSFLEHRSGVNWMIAYNFWEDVFLFGLTDQDELVTKKSALFMSKILEETITYKESFCDDLVRRIMSPLNDNINRSIKASTDLDDLDDDAASLHLKPTLKLIGDVLQYFLDGILFDQKDYRVVLVFLKNFHLEETICDLMVVAQSKCLVFDLGKIMFIMQFLDLYIKFVTKIITAVELNSTLCKIKHNFISSVSKGNWEDFVKFCNFGLFYWKLIETKIPVVCIKKSNEFLPFSCQFLVLTLLPQVCLVMKYCTSISEFEEENLRDDFRNVFIQKLFRMMSYQETVRACYSWRDRLIARPDLFRISKYSVRIVKESTRYYSSDEAVVVFQGLIYILKDVLTAIKESPHKLDLFLNETDYFYLALEIVTSLINEFDITWRNTFEAFDVMTLAFDFLTVSNWSTEVIVQALKLINVATTKCMAPSLALLLDLTADSTTVLLGPLLYAKLLDGVVVVKKVALEVICTMANMSNYSKSFSFFVYFRKK
jgi:hypothetical protein